MFVVYILVVLLVALLLFAYYVFRFAVVRKEEISPRDPQFVDKNPKIQYPERVREGMHWIAAQPLEDVWIESFDHLRLHASYLKAQGKARGLILAFNGWRSLVWYDYSGAARYYHELGFDLLLVDQRCCSESEGRYIGFGVLERQDAKAWTDYAYTRLGADMPLFLSGISMGATTVLLATTLDLPGSVRGIISDCGFISPADILAEVLRRAYHLPAFPIVRLVDLYCRIFAGYSLYSCSTIEAMRQCRTPVFFAHGSSDNFVPCRMSEAAYEACAAPKTILRVPNAGHGLSFLVDEKAYRRAIEEFFDTCNIEKNEMNLGHR